MRCTRRAGQPLPRTSRARAHDGRLRVGYLSADFHEHATSQLMAQMLESHDRAAFEVTLCPPGPDDGSDMRKRMRGACEHFEDLRGQSFEAIARRVRALGIDILVDLKGATHDYAAAGLRPPPGAAAGDLARFPGYQRRTLHRLHRRRPRRDAAGRRGALQREDRPAAALLPAERRRARAAPRFGARRVGGARGRAAAVRVPPVVQDLRRGVRHLVRAAAPAAARPCCGCCSWNVNVQTTLTAAARARGVAAERLLFAPLVPLADHLARLAHADIYLDAWPCNAHTTAGEALWAGVPVVTLKGPTFAQRVAASLLRNVGLDELVCGDREGYVEKVLALADDPTRGTACAGTWRRSEPRARCSTAALRARPRGALPAHVGTRDEWRRARALACGAGGCVTMKQQAPGGDRA